jgi:hypothetical protein
LKLIHSIEDFEIYCNVGEIFQKLRNYHLKFDTFEKFALTSLQKQLISIDDFEILIYLRLFYEINFY